MALHNLKITVIDGGKGSGGALGNDESDDKKTGKNSNLYNALNINTVIKSKIKKAVSPAQFLAIQVGISLAKQTARQFINYYVSDIGRQNGDSNYQAIVNRNIEVWTDAASFGLGAISGAASGAAFGVPGAIVGAVAGAAGSSISLYFKYAERERAYQHEMFTANVSQAYRLSRANYSATTGRLR
jgi:hypothetical protein